MTRLLSIKELLWLESVCDAYATTGKSVPIAPDEILSEEEREGKLPIKALIQEGWLEEATPDHLVPTQAALDDLDSIKIWTGLCR